MEILFDEIARELKGHTNETVSKAVSSLGLELGTITTTGLKLDNFKYEVKYMVLEYLKLGTDNFSSTTDGLHIVATPDQLRPLASGDRVLVAVVNKSDFIIVGRVTNA